MGSCQKLRQALRCLGDGPQGREVQRWHHIRDHLLREVPCDGNGHTRLIDGRAGNSKPTGTEFRLKQLIRGKKLNSYPVDPWLVQFLRRSKVALVDN